MQVWIDREYTGEDFAETDTSGGEWSHCRFTNCNFRDAHWDELTTRGCVFVDCDFTALRANCSVHLHSAFVNARFRMTNLFLASFQECKMTGATFEEANLSGITIEKGDWSYTNLRYQNLAARKLCGVRFADADLSHCNLEKADLREADLTRAILSHAKLKHADLRGANLAGVDLKTVDLNEVRIDFAQAAAFARSYGAVIE